MLLASIVFASTSSLDIALALIALAILIVIVRRAVVAWWGAIVTVGALMLALAAGQPILTWTTPASIAVMVDLSPSTRGATFRDQRAVDQRIHQLLGNVDYQLIGFSDFNQPLIDTSKMREMPCDQTVFSPPPAGAVLLFSDGQFDSPAFAPPTYPVIDPAMDHPPDASVKQLSISGDRVIANVTGTTRGLTWAGAAADARLSSESNQVATPDSSGDVTAAVAPGDLWPENDSLTLTMPPPATDRHWWIGAGCPTGWEALSALPSNGAEYLQASAIVLNNIPADAISSEQQRRLDQYVRDFGGALVIVGGDHAFAAGAYDGSALEDLSPLSSSPPRPLMRWILLVDGSGSMLGDPWHTETAAINAVIPQLPAFDRLSIGSFAEGVHWWSHERSVGETIALPMPPAGIHPDGPTNLAAALAQAVSDSNGSPPTQLMLMTDADADLPDPALLAAAMKSKHIRLYLLALGRGSALLALRQIADMTGGAVLEQIDSSRWIASANQLLRSALPDRYQRQSVALNPGPGTVAEWNQTWLKPGAANIQRSSLAPMIARWQLGLGKVCAIAYPASPPVAAALADQIAQQPNDPRFDVTWDASSTFRVTVNAVDHSRYLNGQTMSIELRDAHANDAMTMPIPQIAPGLYEISIPAPRSSQFVTVKAAGQVVRRFSISGRYPPEFNAIGNNRQKLTALAERTGGAVIEPGPAGPIDFHRPTKRIDLSSDLAIAGFATMGVGMMASRMHRKSHKVRRDHTEK